MIGSEHYAQIFSIHLGRLSGAAATVLLTTLEDGVWLVPLVVQATSCTVALTHAAAFVVTFTLLSFSIGLITTFLVIQGQATQVVEHRLENQDVLLSAAGAALCWLIAAVLYYRAWRKRRRRRQQAELQRQASESETAAMFAPVDSSRQVLVGVAAAGAGAEPSANPPIYGSVQSSTIAEKENENDDERSEGEHQLQIWLVISLTIVGAIDEVSYFPALIVGEVFSVAELTLGTTLASLLILFIVCVALAPFGPVLEFLDRIPLYAVVMFFAIILTVDAVWHYVIGE